MNPSEDPLPAQHALTEGDGASNWTLSMVCRLVVVMRTLEGAARAV